MVGRDGLWSRHRAFIKPGRHMSRAKISDTKVRAILRMRELGFTVARISGLLGVSKVTVYDHINPDGYRDRLRRTTTSNQEKRIIPAERPKKCRLCGVEGTKLYFHVLSKKKLLVGLWLCNSCNMFGDICDDIGTPGLLKRATLYFSMVDRLAPQDSEE